MIKLFIIIVFISIPVSLFFLSFTHPYIDGRFLFMFFVMAAMLERIWETFYTPKGNNVLKHHGDWTLLATIVTYYLISLLMIVDFYNHAEKNYKVVIYGALLFLLAGIIRLWSVKVLGDNWNIHLVDKFQNESKTKIVRSGPYKYIRHPIYLAAVIELVGLSLITHSLFYFLIIFLINVPLYVWRSLYEEKSNLRKFGKEYVQYKKEVPFMIPWRLFTNFKTRDDL